MTVCRALVAKPHALPMLTYRAPKGSPCYRVSPENRHLHLDCRDRQEQDDLHLFVLRSHSQWRLYASKNVNIEPVRSVGQDQKHWRREYTRPGRPQLHVELPGQGAAPPVGHVGRIVRREHRLSEPRMERADRMVRIQSCSQHVDIEGRKEREHVSGQSELEHVQDLAFVSLSACYRSFEPSAERTRGVERRQAGKALDREARAQVG